MTFIKTDRTEKLEKEMWRQFGNGIKCQFNQTANSFYVEFENTVFTNSALQLCIDTLDAYFMSIVSHEEKMLAFFRSKQ